MATRIDTEQLVTPDWVSEVCGVPVTTLYAWRCRGQGPPSYKVGRHLRYRASEVEEWLQSQRTVARD
jgi:predicted DNA-binding transcriptional regulator AlpA